jgi:hypothetical protein
MINAKLSAAKFLRYAFRVSANSGEYKLKRNIITRVLIISQIKKLLVNIVQVFEHITPQKFKEIGQSLEAPL